MRKTVGNRKVFRDNFLIDQSIGRDVTLIVQNFHPAQITEIEVENNNDGKNWVDEQRVSLSSPHEEKLSTTSSLPVRFFMSKLPKLGLFCKFQFRILQVYV